MTNRPKNSVLFLDGSRGQYIPQAFAHVIDRASVDGVSDEEWAILEAGPGHEWYWETWDRIENAAVITDRHTGERFQLYQDGDVWLIPEGSTWPDDQDFATKEDIFIP